MEPYAIKPDEAVSSGETINKCHILLSPPRPLLGSKELWRDIISNEIKDGTLIKIPKEENQDQPFVKYIG